MRTSLAVVFLVVAPLAAPGADDSAQRREQAEQEKLAGAWRVVSVEVDGRALPAQQFRGLTMTFQGGNFTAQQGRGEKQEGTYKIDPARGPKQIDIRRQNGPPEGRHQLAVYALAGNTLKICSAGSDKERPGGFDTRGQEGRVLMTLRREP